MKLQHLNTKEDTMRGLFFIIKGQYQRDYRNKDNHTLGYDPFNSDTSEWYMVLDNKTFTCVSCGSDLQKVLQSLFKVIKRYRGEAYRYFKQVSESVSKVSPSTRNIYHQVFNEFGDYYEDEVREMEDLAYEELKQERPVFKSRKLMEKRKESLHTVETTPVEEKMLVFAPIGLVKPKKAMAVKKLTMVE